MKKVIIVHGWEGGTHEPQLQWLKNKLIENNFNVIFEDMPSTDEPEIEAWLNKLAEISGELDKNTIFVGHSIGCQAVLRYIAKLPEGTHLGGIVLIAPWIIKEEPYKDKDDQKIAEPWLTEPIDWSRVVNRTENKIAIFSDNDEYVDLENEKILVSHGFKTTILHNKYHFDPGSGIKDLPEVLEKILEIES